MCGISGFIGSIPHPSSSPSPTNPPYNYLLNSLKELQNRGYDSAGICVIEGGQFNCIKYASTLTQSAISLLSSISPPLSSPIGIAHTRWATHGPKTDINSHPHICYRNKICLVHNGIIENYSILKSKLVSKQIPFQSQTDTEVIVNLISYYETTRPLKDAITKTISKLEGTWGLVIMALDQPDTLYCIRHGSPLLIGFSDNYTMISSEKSGFCNYVQNYICLNDNDLVLVSSNGRNVIGDNKIMELNHDSLLSHSFLPYRCWTEKEIFEQTESSLRALGMGGRIDGNGYIKLGGLLGYDLENIDNLIILGCGTSYYAGLYAVHLFKQYCNFNTVQLFDASEFTDYDIPKISNSACIMLSQSGETRDLYKIVEMVKDKNILTIGVINVVDSLIAREVSCGVYLNAGREIGVASTKSFTSQVIVLSLISLYFSQLHKKSQFKRIKTIMDLRSIPTNIQSILNTVTDQAKQVANYLLPHSSVFILGKNTGESIAKEGALKLKEIGYIHAEGYSSSALKHGPFALITENMPIIILIPNDDFYNKNCSVIEEVKSRGAYVITIGESNTISDFHINVPKSGIFSNLYSVIVLQLIALELGCLKGINCDFPRNLAKTCVTD